MGQELPAIPPKFALSDALSQRSAERQNTPRFNARTRRPYSGLLRFSLPSQVHSGMHTHRARTNTRLSEAPWQTILLLLNGFYVHRYSITQITLCQVVFGVFLSKTPKNKKISEIPLTIVE